MLLFAVVGTRGRRVFVDMVGSKNTSALFADESIFGRHPLADALVSVAIAYLQKSA
jgi:hypothetical protein